jgi:riboflavin kinase/FMN adenylyltransferase
MKIIRTLDDIPEILPNPVVTIGNFDGVHLGHREIFRRVKESAAEVGGVSVAITFFPHPLKVVAPDRNFKLITTYPQKEALIESSGIDYLISIPFSLEFAAISAEEFVNDILVRRIGVKRIIIGYDYAFGRDREGNVEMLRSLGGEFGFSVEMLEQIGDEGTPFSSSMVRTLIENGDVKGVIPLLGRYFSVGGKVVHGLQRGKELGFPTANIHPEEELLPKPGVYAVKVLHSGRILDGACNIGYNPTFNNGKLTVEVHLLDFDGDLYGQVLRIYFISRIRDERPFFDVSELKQAIEKDIAVCREILAGVSLSEGCESQVGRLKAEG